MAPELFKCSSSYGDAEMVQPSVDIWSLGATLFMMVCGQPPWQGRTEMDLSNKIINVELTFPNLQDLDPHAVSLVRKMLIKEPEERIMLHEIFMSDWVTQEGVDPVEVRVCGVDPLHRLGSESRRSNQRRLLIALLF